MEYAHVERSPALGVPQPTHSLGVTESSTLDTVVPALRFQRLTALGGLSHACPSHDLSEQRHHGHRVHLSVLWPQPSAKHGVADPIVMKCSPGGQQGGPMCLLLGVPGALVHSAVEKNWQKSELKSDTLCFRLTLMYLG